MNEEGVLGLTLSRHFSVEPGLCSFFDLALLGFALVDFSVWKWFKGDVIASGCRFSDKRKRRAR